MTDPCFQQQMPPPAGTGSGYHSFRSSCERCRSQKLKCTVPAGSIGRGPCQRCARAKVECFFGRRRLASRISEPKRRTETISFIEASLESPVTPTTSSGPPCLTLASLDIEPPVQSAMYDVQGWDSIQIQHVMEKATDFANNVSSYNLQHENILDDIFLFGTDQSDSTQCSPSEQSTNQQAEGVPDSSDSSGIVQQLLALLSEMQQRLKMLKEGPWQFGSICGLDDYPIGAILHLSQQFGVIVGPFLRGASELFSENMSTSLFCSDGTAVAALAALLVLSGHISLIRIYNIVLGHFQTHLSQIPSYGQSLASGITSSTLQLGELPCANTARGLGRIHTALCMLQDSLNCVEGQMGRGGVVARDMVIDILRKESMLAGRDLQDEDSGLSRQATAVRGLLREKMSL